MRLATLVVGTLSSAITAFVASSASACPPIQVGRGVDMQDAVWRTAILELVRASTTDGEPWSCTGGTVDLSVHEGGATLTVIDTSGRVISREVASAEDVVPLGEALLAKPIPDSPKPAVRPTPASGAPSPDQPERPRLASNPIPRKNPYAVLGAAISPRYAGGPDLVWGGVTAIAQLPFLGGASGTWLAGLWARYDGPAASLGDREIHMNEICIGTSIAKSFTLSPFELRIGARPSIAVVTESFGRDHDDITRVDGRMGLDANVIVPIASPVRGFFGLDGEFSPRELGEDDHHDPHKPDWMQPRFPAYTFGLSLGVEVAIR